MTELVTSRDVAGATQDVTVNGVTVDNQDPQVDGYQGGNTLTFASVTPTGGGRIPSPLPLNAGARLPAGDRPVGAPPKNVLFLCTGNSARSILAECLLARLGAGRFRAFSAGSHPTGRVHPLALACLRRHGHETGGLRSKGWDELAAPGAPALDFVFTVCDAARGESCPVWPGQPIGAHWGIVDPAAFRGPEEEARAVFERTYQALALRVSRFIALPLADFDREALQRELARIGED